MNYGQILKRSWEILKNNKFLWGLGIWAGLVSGGGGIPSFNVPANFQSPQASPALYRNAPAATPTGGEVNLSMANTGRVLGDVIDHSGDAVKAPLSSMAVLIIVLAVVVGIVLAIIIIYYGLTARAGLILAVEKLETTGEKMTFKSALRDGKKFFWPLLGSGLLYFLYTLCFLLVVGLLVLIGWLFQSMSVIVVLGIIGVIIFFAFLITVLYLAFLYLFVSQMIVLEKLGPISALKKAYMLVKRNWQEMLLSWVIIIGVGLVAGLAVVLLVVIILSLFALFGFGIYFALKSLATIVVYIVLVSLVLFVVMLFVRGAITAYVMIYTTLVYRAVRYIDSQKGI